MLKYGDSAELSGIKRLAAEEKTSRLRDSGDRFLLHEAPAIPRPWKEHSFEVGLTALHVKATQPFILKPHSCIAYSYFLPGP